jgi:putative membrane protein
MLENRETPTGVLAVRAAVGGTLMGLANLVPGISGGTMLLAAGIYPNFVTAIAELTRLRFRLRSILVLGLVVSAAALGILLFAGVVKDLVVDHRWVMYSLFIGLTLGGVPIVWKLIARPSASMWTGAGCGFVGMCALAFVQSAQASGSASQGFVMLALAGLGGASAMILPGLSGGYILLVLGQYVPILTSIDTFKTALKAGEVALAMHEALHVFVPVGLGVVVGIVGVSNLIRVLLRRFPNATLGVLLGLLLGAVVGLWPFQAGVRPQVGDLIKGQTMTEALIAELDAEDYPAEFFSPTPVHLGGSLALILVGFGITFAVSRFGGDDGESSEA